MKRRKSGIFGYRKSNAVIDTIFAFIIMFILALVSLIAWNTWNELKVDVRADISPDGQAVIDEVDGQGASLLDGAFVFVFIGLWIFVIVASLMIDAHPFFFILALILLIFAFIGFAMFGNFYEEFFSDAEYIDISADFPATNFIMLHILQIGIAIGVSVGISLYAKSRL